MIKGKTLNGLKDFTCFSLSLSPAALTIDPRQRTLYYINVSSSQVITLGLVKYTHSMCDSNR